MLGRHADIARMFGAARPSSGPMSSVAAQAWLERLGEAGTVEWVVDAEGQFLGTTRLHSFREDGSARFAVGFFDPERLGRGFGTEVTAVVLHYAFGSLGLRRLDVAVLEFNERAIRCYKRCGFREVGRSSEVVVINGEPHHDVLMEISRGASEPSVTAKGMGERPGAGYLEANQPHTVGPGSSVVRGYPSCGCAALVE
jgi:ribosomal-protein-alanine N-acetyltransferase